MKRVDFFLAYPHVYGGVERQAELIAKLLPKHGWEPRFVLPTAGTLAARLTTVAPTLVVPAPAPLLRYGGRHGPAQMANAARALPAYWRQLKPELAGASIVHSFTQRGAILAGVAARLARIAFVWHVQGIETNRAFNFFGARIASAVLAVSDAVARSTPGLAPDEARVLYNAVDPRWFDMRATFESERPIVCCTARLTPEKGIEVLLRASVRLARHWPDLKVIIMGAKQDGHAEYYERLHDLIRALDLSSTVELRGQTDAPEETLRSAHVYVQPSHSEGFGLAVAEAMAIGLPTIVTNVGGLPEVVGGAGIVVPPRNPRALAKAISNVLADPKHGAALGIKARARAEALFTTTHLLAGISEVYARVAG